MCSGAWLIAADRRASVLTKTAILGYEPGVLVNHLAQAERHIREGERLILRQRQLVDELERHGHGQSQTANLARDILQSIEMAQSAHIVDRSRLKQALAR